jgi:hypothetical protein
MKNVQSGKQTAVIFTILIAMVIIVGIGRASAAAATRISITGPTVIDSPGYYVLQNDIISSTELVCINITSSYVIFDGYGHVIGGTDYSPDSYGMIVDNGTELTNITVMNVTLTDWESGVIFNNTHHSRIERVNASSNILRGIGLLGGYPPFLKHVALVCTYGGLKKTLMPINSCVCHVSTSRFSKRQT